MFSEAIKEGMRKWEAIKKKLNTHDWEILSHRSGANLYKCRKCKSYGIEYTYNKLTHYSPTAMVDVLELRFGSFDVIEVKPYTCKEAEIKDIIE